MTCFPARNYQENPANRRHLCPDHFHKRDVKEPPSPKRPGLGGTRPGPPSEARVNRMRMAFHRPATEPSLFSSLSPPPLPGRPSQEPLQRGPALSPGQPLGRANRKRKLSSQARAGEVGARLSLHGPGEGPSPSFHLEARRLRSVAFRYPGEPALSLPPPCICGSESLAPLRSDFRPLLWRSASLSGPADPVGWPRRVGGLGERAVSVSENPQRPAGPGLAAGGQM